MKRQTLKELVDEGISEDEAWRLFHQISDALVRMSTLEILHRDIKLKNIFIGALWMLSLSCTQRSPLGWVDAKGDCKGVFT